MWGIFIIVALGILLWWAYRVFFRPVPEIRRVIRELAKGTATETLVYHPHLYYREISDDLQTIADRMREMNQKIRHDEFSLRTILGSMAEGVLIVDRNMQIHLVNPPLIKIFGLDQDPQGRSLMEVFHKSDLQERVNQCLLEVAPQSEVLTFEIKTEEGPQPYSTHYFEISAVPLHHKYDDEPIGVVIVFHDITDLKNLENIRKDLLANVSHELRTPLSIIHGYLETLLDEEDCDPELTRKFLGVMYKHTERLNLLIEDLLTISKLENKTAGLTFQPTDLQKSILRVLDRLDITIQERSAEIKMDFPDAPVILEADPHRLDQVFFNLLDNALKYCVQGAPVIVLRTEIEEDMVVIQIQDNGPGIPYHNQLHIFERFYRIKKDRSRDAGGTGLGLSIVKHITHAHGGKITVKSTPGKGTTFTLSLPLTQSSEAASDGKSSVPKSLAL